MNDFLARAVLHEFRFRVAQIERGAQQLHGFAKQVGGLAFISEPSSAATSSTEFAPMLMAMRFQEPIVLMATGNGTHLAVDGGLLDQQRLAAAGRLHFAVGEFGDFEFRGHRIPDTPQLTRAFQGLDKIPEARECHR